MLTFTKPDTIPGAIIFDCDGVLIDSKKAHRALFNALLASLGLPPMTPEDEAYNFTHSFAEVRARMIPEHQWDLAYETAVKLYGAVFAPQVKREPGIRTLLRYLKESEISTAVNTNSGHEVKLLFNRLEIDTFFDAIVTANDVSSPKPAPEGVRKILESLEVSPEKAVYIGDSIVDEQTADSAGIRFWAYKNPDLNAQLHIQDFLQLKAGLESWAEAQK